jgi:poly-gamma-glutamate capsule biosynthesis protein CapA/YwtB (metallophosphatase superfamily)
VRRRGLVFLVAGLLATGCGAAIPAFVTAASSLATEVPTTVTTGWNAVVVDASPQERVEPTPERPTARIAVAGDIMLGRGLARIVAGDPDGIFEEVRFLVSAADIAGANMESPLTGRPHIASNPYTLEADPAAAGLTAAAGFDVLSVANNHAGDAGRASVLDSIDAIDTAGMVAIGGGATMTEASRPAIFEVKGLRVGFLAFDATCAGVPAGADRPGIARWNTVTAHKAVALVRPAVDVLVVAVHGGVEYRTWTDPYMAAIAEQLHDWGVDVVWGSGPHVVQPVYVIDGARPTVVATSLGNFIFDQGDPETKIGAVLEVLVDAGGAAAYRVAVVDHHDRRVHFDEWETPAGDAAMVGTDWWSLARSFVLTGPDGVGPLEGFRYGKIVDGSRGDVDLDGRVEAVVAFTRPFQENPVNSLFPDRPWIDVAGRSSHLGVFALPGLRPEWIAGTLFQPVQRVVACDGSLAIGYASEGDSPGSGGWRWRGFGFTVTPTLDRDAALGCADIDGDGYTDPVVGAP